MYEGGVGGWVWGGCGMGQGGRWGAPQVGAAVISTSASMSSPSDPFGCTKRKQGSGSGAAAAAATSGSGGRQAAAVAAARRRAPEVGAAPPASVWSGRHVLQARLEHVDGLFVVGLHAGRKGMLLPFVSAGPAHFQLHGSLPRTLKLLRA